MKMWWSAKTKKGRITVSRKPKKIYHKETIGILMAVGMLFLTLALLGFHHEDTTWFFFSSAGKDILNWCGIIGAHAASLLLHLFGSGAYVLVVVLGCTAYLLLLACNEEDTQRRLFSLPCIVAAVTVLFERYDLELISGFSGGLLGETLYDLSMSYLGPVGVPLVWWSVLLVGISIMLKLSLITPLKLLKSIAYSGYITLLTGMTNRMHHQWQWGKNIVTKVNNYLSQSGDLYLLLEQRRHEQLNALHEEKPTTHQSAFIAAITQPSVITMPDKTIVTNTIPIKPASSSEESPSNTQAAFQLPDLGLFNTGQDSNNNTRVSQEAYGRSEKLKEKLEHFGLNGSVTAIKPGPLITMFEYQPEISSKISKITALEDDLAMALSAVSIRTIAPIPGKNAVGFEIANKDRKNVYFSDVINSEQFINTSAKLPLALGVDVVGNPIVYDLIAMPHLLIGGTTGSGKSVGLNSMLASLLCRCTPKDLRLILIDPKRLEFTPYADIPHLLFPIVTNASQAAVVLKWVVQEMEDRYERMSQHGVRNVIEHQQLATQDPQISSMPFIAVIIDELADLMVVAGKEIETHIVRIAQMARAAGIHLIVATQRPSVDVVTGLIKVNFPSRVAFRVASKIDSRTILDQMGAEKLLGRGDMLFMHSSSPHLMRIHGAYISDNEIEILTKHLRAQAPVNYLDLQNALDAQESKRADTFEDALYPDVMAWIETLDEVSISMLQRQFRIGFNRSARIIEQLEIDAKIAPAQGSKPRRVLK